MGLRHPVLIYCTCAMTQNSCTCVPSRIRMCVMTHSYACNDSFICVPWLIHMRAMTHSYACHGSVCRRMHIRVLTRSQGCIPFASRNVRSNAFYDAWVIHTCDLTAIDTSPCATLSPSLLLSHTLTHYCEYQHWYSSLPPPPSPPPFHPLSLSLPPSRPTPSHHAPSSILQMLNLKKV